VRLGTRPELTLLRLVANERTAPPLAGSRLPLGARLSIRTGGLALARRRTADQGDRNAPPRSPDEPVERLAHHAVRGALRERAVHYLRQAGLKAAARSALVDARSWFEQALDVLTALPASQPTLEQAFEIRLELRPMLRSSICR
jgi:hypothetical protein